MVKKPNPKIPMDIKKRIIISATKSFAKKGYSNTSLRDIALDAKISKGGVYHHFPTKEDLFMAVCTHSRDLTMKKTLEFLEKKGVLIGGKSDLFEDLCEYYDKIVVKTKNLERVRLEGMMEAGQNPKLKKLMLKMEKENLRSGVEWLKQIRDNSHLLQGYTDAELYDIGNGFGSLYKGIIVDEVMGKDPKEIRMTWVRTIFAIYNSKKPLKK